MEFLVEFEVDVPGGTPASEVQDREDADAAAAARLADEGHLVRVWRRPIATGETRVLGLYRADDRAQLDGLLRALPLSDWMRVTVAPLEPHPNDPEPLRPPPQGRGQPSSSTPLPDPRLTRVYRLEATLAPPQDLGDTAQGHRLISSPCPAGPSSVRSCRAS